MQTLVSPFPKQETLAACLPSIFDDDGSERKPFAIVARKPIVPAMTFPTEIVTCRVEGGSELKLFCKYEAGRDHNAYGHRGGLAYEAEVYRRVLQPLGTTTPRFFGACRDPLTGDTWLILEYLEDATLLRDVHMDLNARPQPTEIGLVARWIGQFHAAFETRLAHEPLLRFLNRYSAKYFAGWAQRTSRFSAALHGRFPWLSGLCKRARELFSPLLEAPPTVVHGEYYQNNILIRDRTVYPTDWESAAVGSGEIDLAALTDGPWAAEIVQQCKEEYHQARWPKGAPEAFERTLAAARLYLHFRWLGERPDWTTCEDSLWRFEELHLAAQQLGIAQVLGGRGPGLDLHLPSPG